MLSYGNLFDLGMFKIKMLKEFGARKRKKIEDSNPAIFIKADAHLYFS